MKKDTRAFITIGQRIAYARKKKGMLQRQLAELIGVKDYNISYWEKSYSFDASTHKSVIKKIANILEVSEDWLIGNDRDFNLTEDSENIKLTKKQQKLVADNENVIGAVFQRLVRQYHFTCEEYADFYGDAAIALCRAAKIFDEKYNNNGRFFSFAFVCVNWSIFNSYMKDEKHFHRTTSLNKIIGQDDHGDDVELSEIIPSPDDEFEQLEYKILAESAYQKVEPVLGNKEKDAFRLYLLGNENPEIAITLRISQHASLCRIWRAKKKCRTCFNADEIFS
jgi:RNA polymerase sigma factor (sigma-70 family)